jgi:hypothetical protein
MNFKDLAKKLKEIQDGEMLSSEEDLGVGECGGMEMPISMISPSQAADDSLNMNVTINSKGVDGIRDLMDVLKGISSAEPKNVPDTTDAVLIGNDNEKEIVIGDDFKNAKHGDKGPKVFNLDSVVFTGDDLASKGGEAVKQAGGGNPWKIRNESLVNHLSSLYEEVKGRNQKKR